MALQFIIGSAGSGKSYRLFEKMIKKSIEEPQSNIVAVVPAVFNGNPEADFNNASKRWKF